MNKCRLKLFLISLLNLDINQVPINMFYFIFSYANLGAYLTSF